METMLVVIITLSLSIAFGVCLSNYLMIRLMRTNKVKKMMTEALDEYTTVAIDVATKAAVNATKKMEEALAKEDED